MVPRKRLLPTCALKGRHGCLFRSDFLLEIKRVKEHHAAMKTHNAIEIRSDILGGTPVFPGTRVPIHNLIDSLEAGDSIDLFLYDFPSVARKQVLAFLEMAKERLLATA